MSLENKILYAFVTGEVNKGFWGRSDLSKYELGVAEAENMFVDYRGGLLSAAGSELGGPTSFERDARLARFQGTLADFVLIFTEGKLRFVQNNQYVVEASASITAATLADPGVFTSNSHGYSDGDIVRIATGVGLEELNNRYFYIDNSTANTFELLDSRGVPVDTSAMDALVSGMSVERAYTVTTPYQREDLETLDVEQRYNTLRLTHINYDRRILRFNSTLDWVLESPTTGASLAPPTGLTGSPSAAGTAGTSFAVTSVDSDGIESVISDYYLEFTMLNYTSTLGYYTLNWAPVANAVKYNVYRSLVLNAGSEIVRGARLNFIGSTSGTQFTDNNVTPDFSKTPPSNFNPFAENTITQINITAAGSGYDKETTMTIGGPGSGFTGYPLVDSSGTITGVQIIDGGSGYTSPTVTLGDTGGGTGATFDIITQGTVDQSHPAIFRIFQQRGVYFSTADFPATLWASKPGLTALDNYDVSEVVNAGDGYSFTIDSKAVRPIRHALALQNGLLIFTDESIQRLRAETGKAVSGVNALAEPQVYGGVSTTPPIGINLDIIYVAKNDASVNALLYTEYTESFQLQDLSILASHLIGRGKRIRRMVHSPDPYKLVYMPREDGTMLMFTYVREQEVFGWTRRTTNGLYRDCIEIDEADGTYLYQIVDRYLQGTWQQFFERVPFRDDTLAENFWGVDCGLAYLPQSRAATLSASGIEGTVTLTTDADVFTAADVGSIIYFAGGKLEVDAYTGPREITATYLRDANQVIPQRSTNPIPLPEAAGEWSIGVPITEITGLWHLEGELVSVNFDGDAQVDRLVTNGSITIPFPSTKIYVGLQYKARGASLPLVLANQVTEGQVKKIFSVIPRLYNTRGLAFGDSWDTLEEMPDRSDEDWGETLGIRTDVSSIFIDSTYERSSQIYWEQAYPLPCGILGLVAKLDVGEE
jgi:hypothetical protein